MFTAQTVIEAPGHTEVIDKAIEPTCTKTGLTQGSHCEVCGEVLKAQTVIDALGHKKVAIGEAIEPTCTNEGITAGVMCENCGEIFTAQVVIPAKGHVVKTIITTPGDKTDGSVKKVCTECGETLSDNIISSLTDGGAVPCNTPVAGICKTYNNYYNKPVLGLIISFCHIIVHSFHDMVKAK